MNELTRKDQRIVAIAEKVAKRRPEDALILLSDALAELEQQHVTEIDQLKSRIDELAGSLKTNPPEDVKVEKIAMRLAAKLSTMEKGADGHTHTDDELRALIQPLIPTPVPGHTPTPQELLALIKPLIPTVKDEVTPSDERLLALIAQLMPLAPDQAQIAREVEASLEAKLVAELPKHATAFRDGLELLQGDERLKASAIDGLEDFVIKRIPKPQTAIAYSRGAVKAYDLSSFLDGSTTTFSLPGFYRVLMVNLSSVPNILRLTTDYTIDGAAMKITFTSQISPSTSLAAGQTCIILYQEL